MEDLGKMGALREEAAETHLLKESMEGRRAHTSRRTEYGKFAEQSQRELAKQIRE